MKKFFILPVGLIFLIVSGVFFSGCGGQKKSQPQKSADIIYWTCAMHPSVRVTPEDYQKGNTRCPICGMDLIPVSKNSTPETSTSTKSTTEMPVQSETTAVKLTPAEIKRADIRTAKVDYQHLFKEIITVGKVAYDPELSVAEEEYLAALEGFEKITKSDNPAAKEQARRLLKQSEYRLKLLGLNDDLIEDLRKRHQPHNLLLPSDSVWIYADVYEYELDSVKVGQQIEVEASAYPGEIYSGYVRSINPTLDPMTRAVRLLAEVKNPGHKLKPEMYVQVRIVNHSGHLLAVPKDAVLDTGLRKIVYRDGGNGEYLAKEVEVGMLSEAIVDGRKEKFYPVKKGLSNGDMVVTRANFLIDSQSQITGAASAAYGGAIEPEKKSAVGEMPPGHIH